MAEIAKNRLEAFSDGVIAIIITIMVLELRAPAQASLISLKPMLPTLSSYVLSYLYLAIYWNNHHHLLQAAHHVNARIMWANLHLLFWLSLFPFVTAWIGKTHAAPWPTAIYGFVFLMASLAYPLLQNAIFATRHKDPLLAAAVSQPVKQTVSSAAYLLAIIFAFIASWVSILLFILVAILWICPSPRLERLQNKHEAENYEQK